MRGRQSRPSVVAPRACSASRSSRNTRATLARSSGSTLRMRLRTDWASAGEVARDRVEGEPLVRAQVPPGITTRIMKM